MGSDTHTSLYACGDRNPMALGLAPPIPDATYLYFMHRQPMGMLLQGPMLATHHHSIYNGITARFLFHAQVSSLVLRFNSTLKTPLSGVYTSSAAWKHCIWRCDRLSTWRKQILCIFAPDAFATLAIQQHVKNTTVWSIYKQCSMKALYMAVWPSLYMKKTNTLHFRPWCICTICNCEKRADLARKSERCVSTRTLVNTNLYSVDIQWQTATVVAMVAHWRAEKGGFLALGSLNFSLLELLSHSDRRNNNLSWRLHVGLFSESYPVLSYNPRTAEDWLRSPMILWLWCRVLIFVPWHGGYCKRFVCSAACNLNRVVCTPSNHKNFDYPCPGDLWWPFFCHPSTPVEWLAICDVDSDVAPWCACSQHQWESH